MRLMLNLLSITPANGSLAPPPAFVRFVYCLGYGKNRLLDRPITSPANSGTPQFWKIFCSCVNPVVSKLDFTTVQSKFSLAERVANKLEILQRMQELGVWLVDTSITALYKPRQDKPSASILKQCLRTSWDYYVGEVMRAAAPTHVVCIGKGVAIAVGDRLKALGHESRLFHNPMLGCRPQSTTRHFRPILA